MLIRIMLWLLAILVALSLYAAGLNNGVMAFLVLGVIAEGVAWFILLKKKKTHAG